jgi:predicted transcriptional regulator
VKSKFIGFRLSEDLAVKLSALCEDTAESPSVILRLLIAKANAQDLLSHDERELLRSVR